MNGWIGRVYEYLATYGLRVLAATVILVVGWWAAKFISQLLNKTLIKGKVDETLANFCRNLCYVILLVFVAIAALNKLGVETTSFAVVVGAVALAIGFGLQGSLANFAAGIMLIMFKPFKTGNFVELAGKSGTVMEIQLFNTIINSPDNVRVIIPNGQVYFEVTEQIKIDLDRNEISIPYPQRDVHMVKEHAHAAH